MSIKCDFLVRVEGSWWWEGSQSLNVHIVFWVLLGTAVVTGLGSSPRHDHIVAGCPGICDHVLWLGSSHCCWSGPGGSSFPLTWPHPGFYTPEHWNLCPWPRCFFQKYLPYGLFLCTMVDPMLGLGAQLSHYFLLSKVFGTLGNPFWPLGQLREAQGRQTWSCCLTLLSYPVCMVWLSSWWNRTVYEVVSFRAPDRNRRCLPLCRVTPQPISYCSLPPSMIMENLHYEF